MLFYPSEREKGKKGGKRGREKGKRRKEEKEHRWATKMKPIGCHGTLISAEVFSDNFFCRWSQKLYPSSKRRVH